MSNQDKTNRIGLGSTTSVREIRGIFDIVEDVLDPKYSCYTLLQRYLEHLPPTYKKGLLFLKKADAKRMKERPAGMRHFQAGYDLKKNGKPTGLIGKNMPNQYFKSLGKLAKWEGKIGGRTARRNGISEMNKFISNPGAILMKSRHKDPQTNTLYNDLDDNEIAKVTTFNHIQGKTMVRIHYFLL